MKEWVAYTIVGIALLVILFGLYFRSVGDKTAGTRSKSDLYAEARQAAQEYLTRLAAKCGEDDYILTVEGTFYRLKGAVAAPIESKVAMTPADNLNHIEWRGEIMIMVLAHREYSDADKRWSEWMDGEPIKMYGSKMIVTRRLLDTNLVKQNGLWSVDTLSNDRFIKPDCSKIPTE